MRPIIETVNLEIGKTD